MPVAPVTWADLERIAGEVDEETSEEWMTRNNIPFETIKTMINSAIVASETKLLSGSDLVQVFGEACANSFLLGWEAATQLNQKTGE